MITVIVGSVRVCITCIEMTNLANQLLRLDITHLYQQFTFSLISYIFQGDFSPLDEYKTYQRHPVDKVEIIGYFQGWSFPNEKKVIFISKVFDAKNVVLRPQNAYAWYICIYMRQFTKMAYRLHKIPICPV